ncbi:MAG: hypothetical protein NTW10_05485 [Bacteroidetes bacterium]|nr:hypothetical protein [Bacteroidota bacterium]
MNHYLCLKNHRNEKADLCTFFYISHQFLAGDKHFVGKRCSEYRISETQPASEATQDSQTQRAETSKTGTQN